MDNDMSSLAVFRLVNGMYISDTIKFISQGSTIVYCFWVLDYSCVNVT